MLSLCVYKEWMHAESFRNNFFQKFFSRYTEGNSGTKALEIDTGNITEGQAEWKRRRDLVERTGGKSAKLPCLSKHRQISPAGSPMIQSPS